MKALNKEATETFSRLVELLETSKGDAIKVNNAKGSFMYVAFERLGEVEYFGKKAMRYSVAHYFVQEGDLIPDPEMTFFVTKNNGSLVVVPASFRDSYLERIAVFEENGRWMFFKEEQADQARFANQWFKNIRWQQNLN